ncbi:MAG: hemerythrin domain-containing protein [Rubrivivax sp.]|nr:hemerythrin domain-containing protein [Rubrivivax sp.]MBK8529134.1 hemerythrin domain-containing protein [Rubrivivax sp.]
MTSASAHSEGKARPSRSPAPSLPRFETLDRTHAQTLDMLAQFDRLLRHVDDNGPDAIARASAQAIHDFFGASARQHHAEEEQFVFPPLLDSDDAELVQHVRRLQQGHGWLEEDWLQLAPQIEAIANGYNWYDLTMLRNALPVFTALYHEHIGLEESLIYPEAKRHQQALQQAAAARDD